MKFWYDKEHDVKVGEPDCVDEWLFDIWAIGFDYDGCSTIDEFKKLVDELVDMSKKARECLWDGKLFGIHGSPEDKPKTNSDRIREMNDDELADFLCSIAYARNTPWSEPFQKKFCDNCPTIRGTYESGQEDDFNECDFVDGVCPHGSDIVWWLKQLVKDGNDDA